MALPVFKREGSHKKMISVSHLTALDGSPEEFIDAAAAAGFEGVGLRIAPPVHTPDQWPVAGDKIRTRDLRKRADDLGIAVFEAESFMMTANMDFDRIQRGLEAASELGVSVLVSAGADPEEARMIESYGRVADMAAPYGLVLGMEFMAFRPMATIQDAERLCRHVARDNARILIDTLHLDRSGGGVKDVAALDPSLIGYIHICDAIAERPTDIEGLQVEARTGRLYPGEGKLPLNEIFDVLPKDVLVSLEAPVGGYSNLSVQERIRLAGEKTLGFFKSRA